MKIYRFYLSLFVITLLTFGCDEEVAEPSQLDQEYEIYSMYLDSLNSNSLVVRQESYGGYLGFSLEEDHIFRFIEGNNVTFGGILERLPLINQDSIRYENKFSVSSGNVILATSQELRKNFSGSYQEAWNSFFEKYGEDAVSISLSRISFNETQDKAVFAASVGRWAYSGYYIYLEYDGKNWQIKEIWNTWTT